MSDNPRTLMRQLCQCRAVSLSWESLPDAGQKRVLWGLVVSSPEVPGKSVVIDTGLTTWAKEPRNELAAAPVLKTVACLLSGWGADVTLPTGAPFDPKWFDDGVRTRG